MPAHARGLFMAGASLPPFRRASQIMGMPAQVRRHWTPDDVRGLMDESRPAPRYELIGGELCVTPAPGAPHQMAVFELQRGLDAYCHRERIGVVLAAPADISLTDDSVAQPDVFVVPDSALPSDDSPISWNRIRALLLVIEVISPSSARTDRVEKRELYLSNGVAEYWVVDLDGQVIEQWTPDRARPTLCRESLVWMPAGAVTPLTIDVAQFFKDVRAKLRARR